MTRTYPIRGSEQPAVTPLATTDIAITSRRRLLPGDSRAAGGEITAAGGAGGAGKRLRVVDAGR